MILTRTLASRAEGVLESTPGCYQAHRMVVRPGTREADDRIVHVLNNLAQLNVQMNGLWGHEHEFYH